MPQVPYNPTTQVQPSTQGQPSVSINAPAAAFGASEAEATKNLGGTISHIGDEIMRRALALQELQNDTEAKEADAKYMMGAGELHAKFSSLQGNAASQAFPQYQQDLQQLRKTIRAGMSNDMARKMYDANSLSVMSRTIFNGAGHAATGAKHAAMQASSARTDLILNGMLTMPPDDVTFHKLSRQLVAEAGAQNDLEGGTSDSFKDKALKITSKAWAHRMVGLSKTDPFKAEEMFEEHRDKLHFSDLERVENTVRSQTRTTGSRMIDMEVNQDLYSGEKDPGRPEKPLQTRINEGIKKARELAPKDDLLPQYVEQRIRASWNSAKTSERDFDWENNQTVSGAMIGSYGGKIPSTVEELTALDPKVSQAWDAMPNTRKQAYLNQLQKNAKGDVAWTPERINLEKQIRGLAQTDRAAFLDLDASSLDLPMAARRSIANAQLQAKKDSAIDPRVTRALSILKPTLTAAKLDRASDKTRYDQFVGSLQDSLELFQQEYKRQPKPEEVRTLGSQLLQSQSVPGMIWGTNQVPTYRVNVPKADVERIKALPMWVDNKITPTDEMVQRYYAAEQFKKLYMTKPSRPKPGDEDQPLAKGDKKARQRNE